MQNSSSLVRCNETEAWRGAAFEPPRGPIRIAGNVGREIGQDHSLAVREVFRLAGMPTKNVYKYLTRLRKYAVNANLPFVGLCLSLSQRAKGVMIDTNSGGYDDLALVRLSQVSLRSRH